MILDTDNRTRTALRPGWYQDPNREHKYRYHDGQSWTVHVTHHGPTPCSGCFRPPTNP
ncbi:MAG: DUF2510 domain-containing protein [Acidimicrobiales bacterium]